VAAVVRRRLTSPWRNAQRSISRALTSAATLLALGIALTAVDARAQGFALDWFTVDGGGGTSTGGVYAVSGTLGQPDAGKLTGGPFTLEGSFWGVVAAIQTPGAPLLTITLNPQLSTVTVAWPRPAEGWVLDWAPHMASPPAAIPWTLVPVAQYQTNTTHIFLPVAPTPGSKAFFRLRRP
jgi:hypothetical protein